MYGMGLLPTTAMKLLTFITPTCPSQRLEKLAQTMLPLVRPAALHRAFLARDVKVNGARVGAEALTTPGAEVRVYVPEDALQPLPILYENGRILAVRKPAGVSCDEDVHGAPTLAALVKDQLGEALPREPLLCHRLDNPTEGIVILAKDDAAREILQEAFRHRALLKTYECLVRGCPSPPHGDQRAWLRKDARWATVKIYSSEAPGAKPIRTEYTVLKRGEVSRLRVILHTGRTHQIRAHMAWLGFPLLGDDQYGDREFNRVQKVRRLMLCARRIEPTPGGEPLPEDIWPAGLVIETEPGF